jgi:hypothetical protein
MGAAALREQASRPRFSASPSSTLTSIGCAGPSASSWGSSQSMWAARWRRRSGAGPRSRRGPWWPWSRTGRTFRLPEKLLEAARAAEEVVLPAVDDRVLRFGRVDVHPADEVLHGPGRRRRGQRWKRHRAHYCPRTRSLRTSTSGSCRTSNTFPVGPANVPPRPCR